MKKVSYFYGLTYSSSYQESSINSLSNIELYVLIRWLYLLLYIFLIALWQTERGSPISSKHASYSWKDWLGQAPLQKDRGTHVIHTSKPKLSPSQELKYQLILKYFNVDCCLWQKHTDILRSPEGQNVVKMYNHTAAVLVEFESVYHRAWMVEVSKLDYGWFSGSNLIYSYTNNIQYPLLHHIITVNSLLIISNTLTLLFCFISVFNVTLLVRHPKTGKFAVNFDPKLTEVIREAKCLLKMGLEVPKQTLCLVKLESKINANRLRLQVNHNMQFS